MSKRLCNEKNLDKKLDKYVELVKDPQYVCKKCGRAAHKAKHVCKPHEM